MTEYWVSKAKFWCIYCKKFIQDNKPSRTNHDNGNFHKENVKRHLKNMKEGREKKEMEDKKTLREIREIEKKVSGEYQGTRGSSERSNLYGEQTNRVQPQFTQQELEYQYLQTHSKPRPKITDSIQSESDYSDHPILPKLEPIEAENSVKVEENWSEEQVKEAEEESLPIYRNGDYVDLLGGWSSVPKEEEVLDRVEENTSELNQTSEQTNTSTTSSLVFEEEDGSDNEHKRKIGSERKAVLEETNEPVTFKRKSGLGQKTRNIRQKN